MYVCMLDCTNVGVECMSVYIVYVYVCLKVFGCVLQWSRIRLVRSGPITRDSDLYPF